MLRGISCSPAKGTAVLPDGRTIFAAVAFHQKAKLPASASGCEAFLTNFFMELTLLTQMPSLSVAAVSATVSDFMTLVLLDLALPADLSALAAALEIELPASVGEETDTRDRGTFIAIIVFIAFMAVADLTARGARAPEGFFLSGMIGKGNAGLGSRRKMKGIK